MKYNFCNDAIRLQMSKSANIIFYIFDFRYDMTCAHHCNTHRNRHTEMDKPIGISEILHICLKKVLDKFISQMFREISYNLSIYREILGKSVCHSYQQILHKLVQEHNFHASSIERDACINTLKVEVLLAFRSIVESRHIDVKHFTALKRQDLSR